MTALHGIRRGVQRYLRVDVARYPQADPLYPVARLLRAHGVSCVFDVGANIGQYASHIRRLGYEGLIVSVEPLTDAARELTAAAADDPRWMVENVAAGATVGEATLNVAGNSVSSSIARMLPRHLAGAPASATVRTETVPLLTLDELADKYQPLLERTYIKVDTQGFERQVLDGAAHMLGRVAGVQLELSLGAALYEGQLELAEAIGLMRTHGFALVAVLPGFTDTGTGEMLQCDGVFFRTVGEASMNTMSREEREPADRSVV